MESAEVIELVGVIERSSVIGRRSSGNSHPNAKNALRVGHPEMSVGEGW